MQVARWAQEDPEPVRGGRRRRVLSNVALTYATRAYTDQGASLWIAKTSAPLATLLRSPATFAGSHASPECREAMRRVDALLRAQWARQLHEGAAWPEGRHVALIDRRFGGELERADVLGVEADEEPPEDTAALLKGGTTVGGSVAGESAAGPAPSLSGTSATSRRSKYSSRVKRETVKRRIRPQRLPPVDMSNEVYELRRAEAAAVRAGRGFEVRSHLCVSVCVHVCASTRTSGLFAGGKHRLQGLIAANDGYNRNLAEQAAPLRAAWAAWNPQRAAARALAAAVARGEVTAAECEAARTAHFAAEQEVPRGSQKAADAGGMAHPAPFRWPAPKSVEVRPFSVPKRCAWPTCAERTTTLSCALCCPPSCRR